MKIKLLKDLPDYKAGHVFTYMHDGYVRIGYDQYQDPIFMDHTKYPDFFQVIDEDGELVGELERVWSYSQQEYSKFRFTIKYLREKGRLK